MHRPAAVADLRGNRLRLVDRRLARLELLALVDDAARLRELRLQGLDVRVGENGSRRSAGQSAVGGSSRQNGASEQESQPTLHEADATVSPGTCLTQRRVVPEAALREKR